jgi:tRNA A37 threonylcarbamoyladenosine synthetase subunit TsaC/SUA5/YrdC
VDAGDTPGGAASTIVDARVTPARLVREGAVPWNRVLTFLAS